MNELLLIKIKNNFIKKIYFRHSINSCRVRWSGTGSMFTSILNIHFVINHHDWLGCCNCDKSAKTMIYSWQYETGGQANVVPCLISNSRVHFVLLNVKLNELFSTTLRYRCLCACVCLDECSDLSLTPAI